MLSHSIGDRWLTGVGAEFSAVNPATGEVVGMYHAATPAEVDAAVGAARNAFEMWASLTLDERAAVANRFADLLKEERGSGKGHALPALISLETGKPHWESLTEVDAMANKVALSVRASRERRSDHVESANGQLIATRYRPHGVAAVLGPFNFPGHLPNGHIVPALLAGNTVVFKPSELTPGVARRTAELWELAELPAGVLNVVQGGRETGEALASHAGIDGLFFTGSVAAGKTLNRALADRPNVIVALEMGGNNPLVVWDAADVEAAAVLAIQSAYLTAGQRCSCARRLIVEAGPRGEAVVARIAEMISRVRVGPSTARPEPFMGPLIRTAAADRAVAAQARWVESGARPIVAMTRLAPAAGAFVSPGLIDTTGVAIPDEEVFAPLLQVIRVASFDDAIATANATAYGLCAALASDDPKLYERFFARARAGVINFNRPTTGASSALPFGGVGVSGNHRPSAYHAADYCAYPVASMEVGHLTMPSAMPTGLEMR